MFARCRAKKKKLKTVQIFLNFFEFFLNFFEFAAPGAGSSRRRGCGDCGTVLQGHAHRGIGPGCWPTEVGARAGRVRDCLLHCAPFCPGATAAVLWRWLTA